MIEYSICDLYYSFLCLPILLQISNNFISYFFREAFAGLASHGFLGYLLKSFDLILRWPDDFDPVFDHYLHSLLILFADHKL